MILPLRQKFEKLARPYLHPVKINFPQVLTPCEQLTKSATSQVNPFRRTPTVLDCYGLQESRILRHVLHNDVGVISVADLKPLYQRRGLDPPLHDVCGDVPGSTHVRPGRRHHGDGVPSGTHRAHVEVKVFYVEEGEDVEEDFVWQGVDVVEISQAFLLDGKLGVDGRFSFVACLVAQVVWFFVEP